MTTPLQRSLGAAWSPVSSAAMPAWFRERQRRALSAALAADWPSRADESWRYTSLHALAQASMPPAVKQPIGDRERPDSVVHGLVFENGVIAAAATASLPDGLIVCPLSRALADDNDALRFGIAREPEAGDVFENINAAFASDGAWLHVDRGVVDERWLTLASRSTVGGSHLAHRIDVGEGARIRVQIDLGCDSGVAGLSTVMSRIRLQRDAQLDLAWIARSSADMAVISRTRIDVECGARLRMHVLDAGSVPSRHDLRVALRGEGAQSQVGGVFLLDGSRRADVQLQLRHDAGATTSETAWRAIANDRSRAVFNGHIIVAKGADGTDAQLSCKSLLASAQAEIDAKPVLEIYADDVKCAHGATVGQLDEQALFYLRTRGLDETAARAMLTRAFAAQAFADIEGSPALATLEAWLGSISG